MKNQFTLLKALSWNTLITAFILFLLLLIFVIMITGGTKLYVGDIEISVRNIRNPFRFLVLFVLLKIWMERKQAKRGILEKTEAFLKNKYGITALLIIVFSLFIWIKVSQHYTFRTNTLDLSIYDHALSNTLKGRFMYTPWLATLWGGDSPDNPWVARNYFSEHFAPILLFLVPFYLLHDGPYTLMVIQAVGAVLAVFPLYHFAKEKLSSTLVPFCIVIAYLNYQYLIKGFLYDFHQEIFEPLFIFAAFLYLHKKAPVKYFIFVILALACKEDVPIYMFLIGGYAWLVEKKWKLGIPTMIISVVWAFIAWKIAIPMSYPDGVERSSHLLGRWSQYGQTYSQIIWGLLTHPSELFGKLFFQGLQRILTPLGYIPLASPIVFLMSIPPLLLNITSEFDLQRVFELHYALPIVPFVFIALVLGITRICKRFPQHRNKILTVFCLYILIMNVNWLRAFAITEHDRVGHELLKIIPNDVTISAQANIIPHLPHSYAVYMLRFKLDAEYILLDAQRVRGFMLEDEFNTLLQKFITDENYTLSFNEEGFYLFKKK